MNVTEFQLMIAGFNAYEPSVMDAMPPPTLDDWTVAIETLKAQETEKEAANYLRQHPGLVEYLRLQNQSRPDLLNALNGFDGYRNARRQYRDMSNSRGR